MPGGLIKTIFDNNFFPSILPAVIIGDANIIEFLFLLDTTSQIDMTAINMLLIPVSDNLNRYLSIEFLSQNHNVMHSIHFLLVVAFPSTFVFYPHQNGYMENKTEKQHTHTDQWSNDILGRVEDIQGLN